MLVFCTQSCAVRADVKGHVRSATLETKDAIHSSSSKVKINTASSAKSKAVGAVERLPKHFPSTCGTEDSGSNKAGTLMKMPSAKMMKLPFWLGAMAGVCARRGHHDMSALGISLQLIASRTRKSKLRTAPLNQWWQTSSLSPFKTNASSSSAISSLVLIQKIVISQGVPHQT